MTKTVLGGLAIVIMLGASVVSVAEDSPANLARLGGAEISRSDLGIEYVGPMIVRDDNDHKSPSFALATIRTPNHDTRLLFLMLFNDHGRQITGAGWSSNSGIEVGDVRHATTAIIHKTKKIRFAFAYKSGDEPSESFAINGKVLGNKTPRVFIVDLSGKEPSLVGINVELPKSVPDFTSDDARQVGREWKRMIAELKRSSPELQKFIDEYARQEIRQNDREKRSGESGEN